MSWMQSVHASSVVHLHTVESVQYPELGGAVIGAIFMGVLNNGMSILGVDANWQKAVKGLVLLVAVVVDVMSKKRVTN